MNAHFELAARLIERGADVNAPVTNGLTPLHHLIQVRRPPYATRPAPVVTGTLDSLDLLKLLLARGARVDAPLQPPKVRRPAGEDSIPRTLTEKMLIYGLGRATTHRDAPAVRAILREAARDGYRAQDGDRDREEPAVSDATHVRDRAADRSRRAELTRGDSVGALEHDDYSACNPSAGPSCADWAPAWRCHFSTRWCRRFRPRRGRSRSRCAAPRSCTSRMAPTCQPGRP